MHSSVIFELEGSTVGRAGWFNMAVATGNNGSFLGGRGREES